MNHIAKGQCLPFRFFDIVINVKNGVQYPIECCVNENYGCTSLQSIVIPESVTEISWRAFARCISLQSIEIHNSETKIEHSAFEGCTTLKSIVRVR